MARTLFFRMVLRFFGNSRKLLTKNQFLNSTIFFTIMNIFFQSAFWFISNHLQRIQWNQKQFSLCCSLPWFRVLLCTHYGSLHCFSTYFPKLNKGNHSFLVHISRLCYFLWLWFHRLKENFPVQDIN